MYIQTIFAFFHSPHTLSRNLSVLIDHKIGQLVDVIRIWVPRSPSFINCSLALSILACRHNAARSHLIA